MHRINELRQAINSAENSLRQAKQLLNELESNTSHSSDHKPQVPDKPGITGIYDGEKMLTPDGEAIPVPGNYASKSLLVVGDTLKMYEENGEKRFKQIEHVKRHKTTGLLVKKDGKFRAITPEGSYKVLTESISHFNGEVGDEVLLHLPAGNLTSPFGAIETIRKKTAKNEEEGTEEVAAPKAEPVVSKPAQKPKVHAPNRHPKAESHSPKREKPAPKSAPEVPSVKAEETPVVEPTAPVATTPGEDELS
jgi:hypothetical protein